MREFDIIVVGGGHAGIEAALAAARLGARCALVTHAAMEIGRMPCNPAIGGLGKGHLVREIDVLGGEMGRTIDRAGIQFRILNTKKGPAVQSPRAQADKHAYQRAMSEVVLAQEGLMVLEADVADLIATAPRGGRRHVEGVVLANGERVMAPRVVLGTGTFLKGLMHVGERRTVGGREGAESSNSLSGGLTRLGLRLKRLKTGTPPRLRRDTIDYDKLTPQPGDVDPTPFSFRTADFAPHQIDCHLAYTHPGTHDLIRGCLDRSPLYAGAIEGQGPRYCPSIEDKVVRFADRGRHLLFLEPEGRDSDEVYVNGLSTSLPADVQERIVHSVPGLEAAELVRFGYAVEYDSIPSWQVDSGLESKPVAGLYLAGQLLGTSGYEEAAGQGLVAGVNAVRSLDGIGPLSIGRDRAYLGVLIDDLVTKEINEPYRMFTSRAEHRLHLRCDNAEDRLLEMAREVGLLSARELKVLAARRSFVQYMKDLCAKNRITTQNNNLKASVSICLRQTGSSLACLAEQADPASELWADMDRARDALRGVAQNPHLLRSAEGQVENDIRYDGYIAKHRRLLQQREHLEQCELPSDFDYRSLAALSLEAREKLDRIRPATLGQAGRIDGVRAGDLAVLTVFMKRAREQRGSAGPGTP